MPTPTVTPDVVGTVIATSQPRVYASYPSPDGKWRAEVVIHDCVQVNGLDEIAYEQLTLIQVSSGVEETVDSQVQYCGGLGAYGLDGWFWSPNSRYFYYTTTREGVPDGTGGVCWDRSLIRLDVNNGRVEHLSWMWALAPEGTMIAMSQEEALVLWSLDKGKVARTPASIPDARVCDIAWSPDSQALVYLQMLLAGFPFAKSYIVHLDLRDLEPTLLLESEEHSFFTVQWDAANQIKLSDYRAKWAFDLVTKDLTPIP